MLELAFSVSVETQPNETIKIVGAIPSLGSWNVHHALPLYLSKNVWEGQSIEVNAGDKCEFKIIKITAQGDILWQTLPNNSNRKFKPKYNCKLHLVWSQAQGRMTPIDKSSFKVEGLPAALIKRVEGKTSKKLKQFDPYQNAHQQQSDSDEQQFMIVRRKISDQIVVNSKDLEQIYYKHSSVQICCGLLRKIKVYVITNQCESSNPLHSFVEDQLGNLPNKYLARWITFQSFLTKSEGNSYMKFKKRSSVFDVMSEELSLQTLYSLNSYFILLELQTALRLSQNSCRVPTCLFLSSTQADKVMDVLPKLSHIQLICYDSPQANKEFYQFLKTRNQEQTQQNQSQQLHLIKPSVLAIVQQLQRMRYHQPQIYNTLCHISEKEGLKVLTQQNSICIIDGQIINKYPVFTQRLLTNFDNSSMLVVICAGQYLSTAQGKLKQYNNVVLIYDSFERVIVDGKQHFPLRNFKQAIQLCQMKSKLYLQKFGGKITEKQSSFIYELPVGKQQWAEKAQHQCLSVLKKFQFLRVSRKGTRLKLSWSLAKQARLIRSLCQIKYLNYGLLGNFNLLLHEIGLSTLRQDLKLLIEHKSRIFLNKNQAEITQHSFDSPKHAISNIVPSSDATLNNYHHQNFSPT